MHRFHIHDPENRQKAFDGPCFVLASPGLLFLCAIYMLLLRRLYKTLKLGCQTELLKNKKDSQIWPSFSLSPDSMPRVIDLLLQKSPQGNKFLIYLNQIFHLYHTDTCQLLGLCSSVHWWQLIRSENFKITALSLLSFKKKSLTDTNYGQFQLEK